MKIEYVSQSIECLTPELIYDNYPDMVEEYSRICFQSEGHIGDSFVKKIIHNQHESVLEHFSLSFKIRNNLLVISQSARAL